MEAGRLADLHAYVDDCLEPGERLAFEQLMAQNPALARRASAGSSAICLSNARRSSGSRQSST